VATGRGTRLDSEAFEAMTTGLAGQPLAAAEAGRLSEKLQVAEVAVPDLTGVLDRARPPSAGQPLPLLFLYSRVDTVIRAQAVEDFIQTCTSDGQARKYCFEFSQHVRHFERHREQYVGELARFAESLGW